MSSCRRPNIRTIQALCARVRGHNRASAGTRSPSCGIQFVPAALPDHVAVGVAVTPRILWIIIDPSKPDARDHLVDLLAHWPANPPKVGDLRSVFFEAGFHVGIAQCPDQSGVDTATGPAPAPPPSSPGPQPPGVPARR